MGATTIRWRGAAYVVTMTGSERIPYHLTPLDGPRAAYTLIRTSFDPRLLFASRRDRDTRTPAGWFTDQGGRLREVQCTGRRRAG